MIAHSTFVLKCFYSLFKFSETADVTQTPTNDEEKFHIFSSLLGNKALGILKDTVTYNHEQ